MTMPVNGYAASAGPRAAPTAASPSSHLAWASTFARRTPPPPHQGQETVLGVPPRLEITLPEPRQGIHSRGPWDASARSVSLSLSSLAIRR